jgi:transposase-like protein
MNILSIQQVPSECKIRSYLKKIIFGKNLFCPHCGGRKIKKYDKRYHCRKCRKFFSLTSISWLKGVKMPLTDLWAILWCWAKEIPVDQTMSLTGKSEVTVRDWFDKFRARIPEDFDLRLAGDVQMDECYRGGKKKGYSIVGAKQKGTRNVVLKLIRRNSVQRHEVIDFLAHYVKPKSNLFTDGASIYKSINNWWPVQHFKEIHKKFQFELTSEIEGLWGNLVTFIRRMYHHVTSEKINDYLREFVARFSHQNWFNYPLDFLKISLSTVSF